MYVIGVDPHKGSHTVAVLDRDEELHALQADEDFERLASSTALYASW